MLNILVLSNTNATAGQMAHGFIDYFTNDRAHIYSAGSKPISIHKKAIETMEFVGIDISSQESNHIDDYSSKNFHYIINIKTHPQEIPEKFKKKAKVIDFNISETEELSIDSNDTEFVTARNKIQSFCEQFIETELKELEKIKAIKKAKKKAKNKKA